MDQKKSHKTAVQNDLQAINREKNYQDKKNKLQAELSKTIKQQKHKAQCDSENFELGLDKETSNLFRNSTTRKLKIDVRNFNKVIRVDAKNKIAEIEGMTSYEDIVKETLKYGLLPPVVPELKSITIGGALAGVGIESSSFKYGFVHETILEYEFLLADGHIVTVNKDNEYRELFYSMPNTYGTLGYALKIKVKLIEAKKFIKLTHLYYNNTNDYFDDINKYCIENRSKDALVAYIDGVFIRDVDMYITLAEFVDEVPWCSNYKYLNIYYESILDKKTDYLKTEDYIWRWDADWFWCSKHFFMQNFFVRLLLGKFLLKSTVYWKIRRFFHTNYIAKKLAKLRYGHIETIIQDIDIPIGNADKFLRFFQSEIKISPIWICPVQAYQNEHYNFYPLKSNTLYINFGFWDNIPSQKPKGYYNRKIEKMTQKLGGLKSLYSDVYYTREEFWKIYDQPLYNRLKTEYDPGNRLKNLYMKCSEQ